MCVPGAKTGEEEGKGLKGARGADGAATEGVDSHQVGVQVTRSGPGGPPSFVGHFKWIW